MKTIAAGKRKRAVARATLEKGTGKVRINGIPVENYSPKISRLKMMEPMMLVSDLAKKVNIDVKVFGGGVTSQADAVRVAISRALVEHDNSIEENLLEYDRRLLVGDVRRKEASKPNRQGKARAKRQKSYR